MDAERIAELREWFKDGSLPPMVTRGEWQALLDAWEDRERLRREATKWRHRCLNHCPCAKLNGNVMGDFDPDKQPCACPIGECEVAGCECEVLNGR